MRLYIGLMELRVLKESEENYEKETINNYACDINGIIFHSLWWFEFF
jgi:hypothetical protein